MGVVVYVDIIVGTLYFMSSMCTMITCIQCHYSVRLVVCVIRKVHVLGRVCTCVCISDPKLAITMQ